MIYLDYAATTPCSEDVVAAMLPYFRDAFANASSIDHKPGVVAREAVEQARRLLADLVGSQPEDVVFTSGSTESNNLVMSTARRVLTTRLEHSSILDSFGARTGADDDFIKTDSKGLVDSGTLRDQLQINKASTLVSVIATNNETGVEQDISKLQSLVAAAGALLHLDATQMLLTRDISTRKLGIGAISLSAHKIYGPKGIGALIMSPKVRNELKPIIRGGGHERGLRSGTLNVPLIVGFGRAAQLLRGQQLSRRTYMKDLRRTFLHSLRQTFKDSVIETVDEHLASPHILSIRLAGTNARALLGMLRDEVAFSLGSACSTNKSEPSHVLGGLGLEKRHIVQTFRVSFSHELTLVEAERSAREIGLAATALNGLSVPA